MEAIAPITADALTLPGIAHAFFTRSGGVSTGIYADLNAGRGSKDDPQAVAENRRRMAQHFQLPPAGLISMNQTHSADVVVVAGPTDERIKADGLVTKTPNVAVSALAADCAPVLFADVNAGVIGATHSGWRGAVGGVLEATLSTMEAEGARRDDTVAVVGPTIAQASYEVGPEFFDTVVSLSPDNERFFVPSAKSGHHMFDLPGYVIARLTAAGIGSAKSLGLDTYADEARFFSYRRTTHRGEPDYGRLLSAIMLKD